MHGMAGSAALLGLAVSAVADPIQGVAYVVLFGLGSMLGMGALSSVIAVPLLSDPIRYDIPKCRGPGRLANGRGFSALGSICVLVPARQGRAEIPYLRARGNLFVNLRVAHQLSSKQAMPWQTDRCRSCFAIWVLRRFSMTQKRCIEWRRSLWTEPA